MRKILNLFVLFFVIVFALVGCNKKEVKESIEQENDTIVVEDIIVMPKRIGIKMQKTGGVYEIPCLVNGVKMNFIFDTGASNVCISLTEALFLYKNGYISDGDIGGQTKSVVADGRITTDTKLKLKTIEIAGVVLKDVDALVSSSIEAPLLLGQSAIEKLGKFEIDGDSLFITGIVEKEKETVVEMGSIKVLLPKQMPQKTLWDKILFLFDRKKEIVEYMNMAYDAYENDFFELAISYCDKALEYDKKSWVPYAMKGHCKYKLEEYVDAIEVYKSVIKLNKYRENFPLNNGDSITYLACIYRLSASYGIKGYYDEALILAQEELAYFPQSVDLYNVISYVYTEKNNYNLAEKWAKKILELDKSKGYFRLAYLSQKQGRNTEAIKYYKLILEEDSEYGMAMNNLSNIYWKQGRLYEAIELRKQAARLGNEYSQKWLKENNYDW